MLLLCYYLLEGDSYVDEIRAGLVKKMDTMVLCELYSKSKTALTEEEREKTRQEYLGRCGISDRLCW